MIGKGIVTHNFIFYVYSSLTRKRLRCPETVDGPTDSKQSITTALQPRELMTTTLQHQPKEPMTTTFQRHPKHQTLNLTEQIPPRKDLTHPFSSKSKPLSPLRNEWD
jgi:hypothetical protein